MCAEASTVLRAVAVDFFFNCWYLEIPSDNRIRHILHASDAALPMVTLKISPYTSVTSTFQFDFGLDHPVHSRYG
jgi:hypothetical protein